MVMPSGLCQPGCALNSYSNCGESVGYDLPYRDIPCSLPPRESQRNIMCVLKFSYIAKLDETLSNLRVEGIPAHGRELGTRWSLRPLPTQTIP